MTADFKENMAELLRNGQYEQAEKIIEDMLALFPDEIEYLQLAGAISAQLKKYDRAEHYLRRAITNNPSYASLFSNLGNVFRAQGFLEKAEHAYQEALRLDPNYADAHNNLGAHYAKQSQFDKALQHYAQAIRLIPGDIHAHYNVALLFFQKKQYEEAKREFQNVLQLHPQHLSSLLHLGDIAYQQELLPEALDFFDQALKVFPQDIYALNNRGAILAKQAKAEEALSYFNRALLVDVGALTTRSNLAACLMQLDRFQEAIHHYQLILEKEPENQEAHYNMGVAKMMLGVLPEAVEHFNQVIQYQPKHFSALSNLAVIALRQGKTEAAKQYYEFAKAASPHDTITNFMLSALDQKEDYTRAPEIYVKELFDNYALTYDKHMTQTLGYCLPAVAKDLFLKQIDPVRFNRDFHLLDLGCGSGLLGEVFSNLPFEKTGVDLSPKMIAIAEQKKYYDHLYVDEIIHFLQAHDVKYDAIFLMEVVNYFGDLSDLFQGIYQRLKKGGLVFLSIETHQQTHTFTLLPSGRFGHASNYVCQQAEQHGLTLLYQAPIALRKHHQEMLPGHFFIFRGM